MEKPKYKIAIILLAVSLTLAGIGERNQAFFNKLFDKLKTKGIAGLVADISRDVNSLTPKEHNVYSLEAIENDADLRQSLLSRIRNSSLFGLKEDGVVSYVNGVAEQYIAKLAVVNITNEVQIIPSNQLSAQTGTGILLPPSQFNTDGTFMMYASMLSGGKQISLSNFQFFPGRRGGAALVGNNFLILNSSELKDLVQNGQPNFVQEFGYTVSSSEGGTSVLDGQFVTSGAIVSNMESFKYAFATMHFTSNENPDDVKTITLVISDVNAWKINSEGDTKAFTIAELYDIANLLANQIAQQENLTLKEINLTTPDPAYDVTETNSSSSDLKPKVYLEIPESTS